jgi:KRAB domain-containing zinc finger protein
MKRYQKDKELFFHTFFIGAPLQFKMNTNKMSLNTSTLLHTNYILPETKTLSRDNDISVEPLRKMRKTSLMLKKQTSMEDYSPEADEVIQEKLSLTQRGLSCSSLASEPLSPDRRSSGDDKDALKCGQCSKNFAQRNMLQMHLCPKQTNSPYQCGHCHLSFTNPSDLRSHVVRHVSEKPFKCGFCARSFVGSTTLNNHIRMHTGEKLFNCKSCGVTFSQGAHYARHLREDCHGNVSVIERYTQNNIVR